ncbi:protein outspread [Pristis pectinata]|uniref:protein outspread n=1 Tax=Pristis pectinata TaxID=685728 RepID=UPI00223DA8BC|nr:protein outspread [Pristis pectinata]
MASEDNGKDLIFEGYLKKQKDKMKFAWAKYWFRLQNTTLFFFTDKQCEACHLRGQYYIYMVQSVREMKDKNREYPFEIVMKNGKRKLLAAESSDLRAVWMEFLWKAMQLPGPGKKNSACTWHDIPHLIQRAASLCQDKTKREDSMGSLSSTDTQSEGYTLDTLHLTSTVASRETLSPSPDFLDESYNMCSSNVTSSSEGGESVDNEATPPSQDTAGQKVETDVAPSLVPKAADRVNCQSGIYNVPKPVSDRSKITSAVQTYHDEPLASSPDVGLLEEIISDFRNSTSHWLDPADTQNASIPS